LRYPDKLQLSLYRKASCKARNIIKSRKKTNFNKFIDELDPNNDPKNFWKTIKLFRNSSPFNPKSSSSTNKLELINTFIDGFAPSSITQRFSDCITTKYPFFFNLDFQLREDIPNCVPRKAFPLEMI